MGSALRSVSCYLTQNQLVYAGSLIVKLSLRWLLLFFKLCNEGISSKPFAPRP